MLGAGQEELLAFFLRNYELDEVAWSMAEHGYFEEEPLLTIVDEADSENRIVVEGNRRLATLILLTDPTARERLAIDGDWADLAALAADHALDSVPTRRYGSRDELLQYLGFRHVSGLMQWSADAKARFIYNLVREHGYSFKQAARAIGSRSDAIRRQYVAWAVLAQSRQASADVDAAVTSFGVFYRSLQNPGIRSFVHLSNGSDPWLDADETLTAPLPDDGPERVEEFVGFVWGPKRVIRDSRELDDLARVLSEPGPLAVLRLERKLDVALDELPAHRDDLYARIRAAYRNTRSAYSEAHKFVGDAVLIVEAEQLKDLTERLVDTLTS